VDNAFFGVKTRRETRLQAVDRPRAVAVPLSLAFLPSERGQFLGIERKISKRKITKNCGGDLSTFGQFNCRYYTINESAI
jgi:hypothetical protein